MPLAAQLRVRDALQRHRRGARARFDNRAPRANDVCLGGCDRPPKAAAESAGMAVRLVPRKDQLTGMPRLEQLKGLSGLLYAIRTGHGASSGRFLSTTRRAASAKVVVKDARANHVRLFIIIVRLTLIVVSPPSPTYPTTSTRAGSRRQPAPSYSRKSRGRYLRLTTCQIHNGLYSIGGAK